MSLRYTKYQNKSQIESCAGLWFARAKHDGTIGLKGIAQHMADHNSAYSRGTINGVLADMADCIKELLLDGKKVKIDDLVILSVAFHCKGAARPEDLSAQNITGFKVRAQGTGNLTSARVSLDAKIKELDHYNVSIAEAPATGGA